MGLINNPAFLDRDLGSTNGLFVRFGVANPKITAITCIGEITVSSIVAGEVVETTYTDLESAQLDIQADANTTVRIVGDVTELVLNEERATFLDLRALRSLRSLTLHQNTATFTLNLAGCRKLQTLDLSDCWLLRSLDLSQNTQLESLNLAGCRDLQSLDLSANKFLLYVDLTDCRSIPYLDVTMLTNLEELKIDGTQLQSPGNNLIITKAIGGGGSVPQGVAMEETSQEILAQVQQLNGLGPDVTYGKTLLAQRITNKGVLSTPEDSLVQMAEKVHLISQNPITINTSVEYEEQLTAYGSLWNLYNVRAAIFGNQVIKNDYPCFILGEYFIGYDTIELQGASAYITSDNANLHKDEQGNWVIDIAEIEYGGIHTWHDDGIFANRWVCYLFATVEQNFLIPSTELCPRSIYVAGHVGTISSQTQGRLSGIIIPSELEDGESINQVGALSLNAAQEWGQKVCIHNVSVLQSQIISNANTKFAYIGVKSISGTSTPISGAFSYVSFDELETYSAPGFQRNAFTTDYFSAKKWKGNDGSQIGQIDVKLVRGASVVNLDSLEVLDKGGYSASVFVVFENTRIKSINLPNLTTLRFGAYGSFINNDSICEEILLPKFQTMTQNYSSGLYSNGIISGNLPNLRRILLGQINNSQFALCKENAPAVAPMLLDIEVGEGIVVSIKMNGWNPTTVLSTPEGIATINSNIREHIAAKVSDRTGLSALTFTVSTNLYNNLEQATIDAFAAKNWNVAGA